MYKKIIVFIITLFLLPSSYSYTMEKEELIVNRRSKKNEINISKDDINRIIEEKLQELDRSENNPYRSTNILVMSQFGLVVLSLCLTGIYTIHYGCSDDAIFFFKAQVPALLSPFLPIYLLRHTDIKNWLMKLQGLINSKMIKNK